MLIRKPSKTLVVPIDNSATSYHRLMQPFYWLTQKYSGYPVKFITGSADEQKDLYNWADVIYIQCLYTPGAFQFYSELKKKGKKIIMDFDDDYINIPEDSPEQTEVIDHETGETYKFPKELRSIYVKQFAAMVDTLVVTTKSLKSLYSYCNKSIEVIPNCVSRDMFRDIPKQKNDKVKVLWTGSSSHLPDLELLKEPLSRIMDKYSDQVELCFQGPLDFSEIFPGLPIECYPAVPYVDYLNLIQDINPDITLGPLKANAFNASKSNIKYLQMTILESSFIGSNFGPYAETIDNGYDGLLASDAGSWYSQIETLILNENKRLDIMKNAIKSVEASYLIDNYLDKWKSLLSKN